jgi:hypothetical protein
VNTQADFLGTDMWLTAPAGDSIASVTEGNRCEDIDYAGTTLSYSTTYHWRIIFKDAGGAWSALPGGTHSFTTAAEPNVAPDEPTQLFVDGTNAQSGTAGNPVTGVDLTPVFSAIFNDSNSGDISTTYRIQVHTDPNFVGDSEWLTGTNGESISPVTAGNRCEDIPYAGTALEYNTTYYWRMIFKDQGGLWSAIPTTQASFTTIADPNTAPTAPTTLHVHSTDAQGGDTSPATGVDLTPVFSALFNDVDTADSSVLFRIQVNDTSGFTGTDLWISDTAGEALPQVNAGDRCSDIAYGGSALSSSTTYFWRIRFADSAGEWSPWSAEATFTTEATPTSVAITTTSIPDGEEGTAYSATIAADSGTPPYTFRIRSGELPTGISLATDGTISGTPESGTAGSYTITVQVTDAVPDTDTRQFSMDVTEAPAPPTSGGGGGGGGGCLVNSTTSLWSLVAGLLSSLLLFGRRTRRPTPVLED